jgi:hypothetical protein
MEKETLEEAAIKLFPRLINDPYNPTEDDNTENRDIWISGAKWQAERMYSEEDLREAFFSGCQSERQFKPRAACWQNFIEQFKKK